MQAGAARWRAVAPGSTSKPFEVGLALGNIVRPLARGLVPDNTVRPLMRRLGNTVLSLKAIETSLAPGSNFSANESRTLGFR